MRLELNGRPCEATAEHGRSDEDSMFVKGHWLDEDGPDGEPKELTEEELDELAVQYADELYTLWLDHQVGIADFMFEADD